MAISRDISQPSITEFSQKIIYVNFHSNLPKDNQLTRFHEIWVHDGFLYYNCPLVLKHKVIWFLAYHGSKAFQYEYNTLPWPSYLYNDNIYTWKDSLYTEIGQYWSSPKNLFISRQVRTFLELHTVIIIFLSMGFHGYKIFHINWIHNWRMKWVIGLEWNQIFSKEVFGILSNCASDHHAEVSKKLECAASNGNRYPPYPQVMATAISQ